MEDIEKMLQRTTGGITPGRMARLARVIVGLPAAAQKRLRLEECQDERTGARFGKARCRAGKCAKIGGGGRNQGSTYAYQIWAVWS
jgi:hypothetical protein